MLNKYEFSILIACVGKDKGELAHANKRKN